MIASYLNHVFRHAWCETLAGKREETEISPVRGQTDLDLAVRMNRMSDEALSHVVIVQCPALLARMLHVGVHVCLHSVLPIQDTCTGYFRTGNRIKSSTLPFKCVVHSSLAWLLFKARMPSGALVQPDLQPAHFCHCQAVGNVFQCRIQHTRVRNPFHHPRSHPHNHVLFWKQYTNHANPTLQSHTPSKNVVAKNPPRRAGENFRPECHICLQSNGSGFSLSASCPNSCSGAGTEPALTSFASSA